MFFRKSNIAELRVSCSAAMIARLGPPPRKRSAPAPVMSFEILFPFGLWVSEPGWLLNHSQLV